MKDKCGFGIIGAGVSGWLHAKAVSNIDSVELVGISDSIPEKAEGLKDEFGANVSCADYDSLLSREDIDIVSICTPSGTHADVGEKAAAAGKHIITEKPIEVTLERADRLVNACKNNKVKLACVFQRRVSDLWQLVQSTIAEGKLGKMILASTYLKYSRTQEYYDSSGWRGTWALDGGGALINQGTHMIDVFRWIMGPVDTVFGFADHLARSIEVEDTAVASLRFSSGAFGTIEGATSLNPGMEHRLEFHGELGTIRVEGEDIVEWNVPGQTLEWARSKAQSTGDSMSPDPRAVSTKGHETQIRDLLAAIREDRDPMIAGEEAKHALELILAIYESSRTGQPVRLSAP